ncbi:MFS transporter [Microbacterium sp. Root61]|uniref:MFS transporter n=1 Tax=Microbacterium sp. Root61 TaxID=1736570 RepID=UPI00138EDCC4|nr:MFS transporter [Microbacterium sp. Root61]
MAMMQEPSPATEPIPVAGSPGWRGARHTLAIRNYRFLLASMFTGFMAAWISRITQDWILLEMTQSVAAVGLAVTFQFAPILLLGLWGGVLTDRFPRLRIARIAQTMTVAGLLVLMLLLMLNALQVWHIYALAAVSGLAAVAESPARSALVTQIVPPNRLQAAIGLNATALHVASLIGAAGSGILIAVFGARWAVAFALLLAVIAWGMLACVRTSELQPVARAGGRSGMRAGIHYAYRKPTIRWSLILIAFIATFGMTHTVLYAAAARDVGFDSGAAGYGLYFAVSSAGAILGAVVSMGRRSIGMRSVLTCAIVFGATMLATAAAFTEPLFLVAIVCLSATRILCVTGIEALFQLSANPSMRGRVAALYFAIVAAGQCVGPLLIGWVAESVGLHTAFALAGGIPLVAACVLGIVVMRSRELRLRIDLRRPRRLIRIVPRTPVGPVADLVGSRPGLS